MSDTECACPVLCCGAFALPPFRCRSMHPATSQTRNVLSQRDYISTFRPLLFCSRITQLSLFCTETFVVPSISIPFHLSKDSRHNKYFLFGPFFKVSGINVDITLLPPSNPLIHSPSTSSKPASKPAARLAFSSSKADCTGRDGMCSLDGCCDYATPGESVSYYLSLESQRRSLCLPR